MEEKQRNRVGYCTAYNRSNKIKDFKNGLYSVIPSKILYNKELKANEKFI